ncbi:unnamed protein product, partial [Meganyctiphanes norvegica]
MASVESALTYHEKKGNSGRKYGYTYNSSKKEFIKVSPYNIRAKSANWKETKIWTRELFLVCRRPQSLCTKRVYIASEFLWDLTTHSYAENVLALFRFQSSFAGVFYLIHYLLSSIQAFF